MSFDFKVATPDTSVTDDNSGLFGADSQSASTPSWYSFGTIKAYLQSFFLRTGQNLADLTDKPSAIVNLGAAARLYSTYVSGRYYGLPFYSYTGTASPSANRIAMIPFFVLQKVTISAIGLRTVAGATGNWQSAVYASDPSTCRPTGTPLAQSSASASTAGANTNVDSAFASNVQLLPGVLYWLAWNTDTGTPTYYSTSSVLGGPQILGSTTNTETLGGGLVGVYVAQTYAAGTWLDMTSQTFTALNANTVPGMIFKVASIP